MKGSKLLELYSALDGQEIRQLEDFYASPYFNKNEGVLKIFRLLKDEWPEFDDDAVDRYLIWHKAFPKRAFDDNEFRYLNSTLLKLAEQFIGLKEYESSPAQPALDILTACRNRDLSKHYRSYLKRLDRKLERSPFRNEDFYNLRFNTALNSAGYFHRKQTRIFDQSLQDAVDYLDEYYLITKLHLTCELINRQNIISASYDIRLVDELMEYLQHYNYQEVPAMEIYYRILSLLTQEDTRPHFQRLKDLIREHIGIFPGEEKLAIYANAQNYCIRMIKTGDPDYLQELFELYQTGLEQRILIEDGVLSPWKFKNIVSAGLRLGHFDWVEGIMADYGQYLPDDYRSTAVLYNRANLLYHQGEFSEALRLLNQVEFSDVYYSLDTRKIMLMIYFQQQATEPLLSLVSSFRLFLRRNKLISDRNRSAYKNFIDLVQLLWRVESGKEMNLDALLGTIRDRQPLVEEEWLRNQAKRVLE